MNGIVSAIYNIVTSSDNMPLVATKLKPKKTTAVIADATDRLLREVKQKMLREKGRIDYDQLVRDGYSAEMIARLKAL
jgi:hypothetical protein